jgi:N-acetylmuramoyl-L-alanine amidase
VSRSPNHGPRRDGLGPELVVLHYTAMPDAASAERALCDPAREVSCHWLIARDGTVTALVDEEMRAWHAGAGSWGGREDVNSRSIGIELDNDGASPFAAPLMDALEELLGGILARWTIPPAGVIAHSDMTPGRKRDPGPRFDWRRLARQGLSVWPAPGDTGSGTADWSAFREGRHRVRLSRRGRRAAPRRGAARFRPGATGPLDATDCAIAAALAKA